jgi:SNF2 family DNA or RNA helicase
MNEVFQIKVSDAPTDGNYRGMLQVRCDRRLNDRIDQIPGRRDMKGLGQWAIPKRWPAVLALGTIAKEVGAKIERTPDLDVWIKNQAVEWRSLRELSGTRSTKGVKDPEGFYLHQIDDSAWLLDPTEEEGRLLLNETGAGKTVAVTRALRGLDFTAGPVLIAAPESTLKSAWFNDVQRWAPNLRVVICIGTITQRRKILAQAANGEWDVVIIGHTNLKSHTRFEPFPGQALRRCVSCGGAKLTRGDVDEDGNPMPDIDYHTETQVMKLSGGGYRVVCKHTNCTYMSETLTSEGAADEDARAHNKTGKVIKEVTVAMCQTHSKELNEIPLQAVVLDEAHRVMNARSQLTQAAWGVAKYAPSNPRRWALTGTPISTETDQIWPLLHFVDPAAWPVKSKWIDYYCEKGFSLYTAYEVIGLRADRKDEFRATFDAVARRVLKDECVDLPPKIRGGSLERRLIMTGEQLAAYKQMADEMILQVREGLITASNVLVKARRLSMLASGTGYPDPQSPPGQQKMLLRQPSVKLTQMLAEFKDGEFADKQLVIGFSSLQALLMVHAAFISEGIGDFNTIGMFTGQNKNVRERHLKDFQEAGTRKIMMLTYAAGGTGITLTAAADFLMFERDWSPILNYQSIDRTHRITAERHSSINYHDYVVENSNEIRQMQQLEASAAKLEDIVNDREKLLAVFAT